MRYPSPTSSPPRRSTFARKPTSLVTRKPVRMANREEKAFDVFIENFPWTDQAERFRWFIDLPARELPGALTQLFTEASDIVSVAGEVSATVTDQVVMQGRDGTVLSCLDLYTRDKDKEQAQGKLQDDELVAKEYNAKDALGMCDWIITVTHPGESDVLKKISLPEDTTTRQTLPIDVQRILLECMSMAGSNGTIVIARSTHPKTSSPNTPNNISSTPLDTPPPVQARLNSPMPSNEFLSTSSNIFLEAPARDTIYTTSGTSSSETMLPELMKSTSSTLSKSFLPGESGGTGYAPSEASVSSGFAYISPAPLGSIPATSARRNSRAVLQGTLLKPSRDSLDPLIMPGAVVFVSAPSQNVLAISPRTSVLNGTSRLASLGFSPSTSMSGKKPATADAILTYKFMDSTPSGSATQGDVRIFDPSPENHTFGAGVGTTGISWPPFAFRMSVPTVGRRLDFQSHKTQVFVCLPALGARANSDKNHGPGSASASESFNTTRIEVQGFAALSTPDSMTFSIPAAISGAKVPSSLKRKLEFADPDDSLSSGYMWPDITRRQQRDGRSACDACETAPRDIAKAFAIYCNHYIP